MPRFFLAVFLASVGTPMPCALAEEVDTAHGTNDPRVTRKITGWTVLIAPELLETNVATTERAQYHRWSADLEIGDTAGLETGLETCPAGSSLFGRSRCMRGVFRD